MADKTVNITPEELSGILSTDFIENVPFNVAVIDKNHQIVFANESFKNYFGNWEGKYCYQVYKKTDEKCRNCQSDESFVSGKILVSNETGYDKHGRSCQYVNHYSPIRDKKGNIPYQLMMSTDIIYSELMQKEYSLLFEKAACYITVIDRDFRIVRANQKFRDTFGSIEGKHCYEVYKKKKAPCNICNALETFEDGMEHSSAEVGLSLDGEETHYVVTTTPLTRSKDGISLVLQMAIDITEIYELETQLERDQEFFHSLLQHTSDGVLILDQKNKVIFMNKPAQLLLNWKGKKKPNYNTLKNMFPEEFFIQAKEDGMISDLPSTTIRNHSGEEILVRFKAFEIKYKDKKTNKIAFITDLRNQKKTEEIMFESKRDDVISETLAGISHSVKNLLMSLEGGMYLLDSGIKNNDSKRLNQGWGVLNKNLKRTTNLVKSFVDYTKGKKIELKPVNPVELTEKICEYQKPIADKYGIRIVFDTLPYINKIMLDPDGIEICLSNLISNAIDAVMLSGRNDGKVNVRVKGDEKEITFEISDNGIGMNKEVKAKLFSTFFTTKGGQGPGLGLLTIRKIVSEHSGRIEFDSNEGKGSVFRIIIPAVSKSESK
ncbi:MAG: PAS domain-containing protein [Ignavibacteriae bacterium]|nr:PAS domain-containing protein [Ignavibacteriota bacterium]